MTLAVIRILSSDNYGLMAITRIFVSITTSFTDIGTADALVQRQDMPRRLPALPC